MTHRYRRYADTVGIRISLKETWHYSATQLLAAGVDLNTVAGRPPGRRPGRAQSINGGILSRLPGRLRRQVQVQEQAEAQPPPRLVRERHVRRARRPVFAVLTAAAHVVACVAGLAPVQGLRRGERV